MGEPEGVATRASKRRRISAPSSEKSASKSRSRARESSPDELANDAKPSRQRVTAVTIPTLQNVVEEREREREAQHSSAGQSPIPQSPAAPSPAALSPNLRPPPAETTPEKARNRSQLSPAAPSSYSPVTQYDDEEEIDIIKATDESHESAEEQHVVTQPQPDTPNAEVVAEEDHEMTLEEEADDYAALEEVQADSPQDADPNATNIVHTFYRDPYNKSFSASARRNSHDVKPSRSPSAPAYSRISTPLASPAPEPRKEAVYRPYKLKMSLKGHKRGVAMVRVSPNQKMIASCAADATVRVWDSATGKHLNTFEGHLAGISTLAWAPDSRTIASGSDDKSIRLWDVPTGKAHPYPLVGHHNYIYSIAFSPKGNILVSGSYDEAVFLWDIRTRRILRSLPAHSDPVGGVDFVRDGTLIVSCAGDGLIRIWDTGTGQCLRTLVHEDNAPVTSVRFSPNGRFVLAWTLDASVRLWDYVEGRCVKTYQGHGNAKYSLGGGFGVYGDEEEKAFVVSGSEEGALFVWDVVSKEILQRIDGVHEGVVLGVDTAKGWMVSGGLDKLVQVWERDEVDEEVDVKSNGVEKAMNGMNGAGERMEGIQGPAEGSSHGLLQVPVEEGHPS